MRLGAGDFLAGAFADVAADVDDEDFISYVNLVFVHVVNHDPLCCCVFRVYDIVDIVNILCQWHQVGAEH